MLERTAGCLESGSLRRLLPASRKSLKSCRTLHSGFWTHGGGDLELSPFWAALVQTTASAEQQDGPSTARTLAGNTGMLLDFLYPAGTLNFIRQYSHWGLDRQDGRWARHGVARIGQRQYTSSAQDSNPNTDAPANSPMRIQNDSNIDMLLAKMNLTRDTDFEEAWRQYDLLPPDEQVLFRPQLMIYLSPSDRVVDMERVIDLYKALEEAEKTKSIYRVAVKSFLKLRNLADAMEAYNMAVENLGIPAGSEELLAYLFNNASWTRALSLWEDVTKNGAHESGHDYNIYEVLDEQASLASQVFELAAEVNRRRELESSDPETTSKLMELAAEMIRRALLNKTNFRPYTFTSLMQMLQRWKLDTFPLYESAIHMLLSLKEPRLAIKCYRKARLGDTGSPFRLSTLERVLRAFCEDHNVLGMKEVLDDFFRTHGRPTGAAYRLCMQEFAARGDARTVHALWEQYVSRFTYDRPDLILTGGDFAPILNVYAVRGELHEVIKWFEKMKTTYGVRPLIICWNILLNAYGKVQDIEGAYACFEQILNSDCKPTDYTIGTMMGICTQQGDIDRAIELYILAENMGIEKSMAMLDNLVYSHIQEDDLEQAEKICVQGLSMRLLGTRTRMWNYLLVAYALRRDLNNVNRVLQRMSEAGVTHDLYTYSALMQALCMVKQPDRAFQILRVVMPDAGVKITNFHYSVVMGGFIANNEPHKAFLVQDRMLKRQLRESGSTKLLAMKARLADDEKTLLDGTDQEVMQGAMQLFQEAMRTMDVQDIVADPKKGASRLSMDVAYPSMFYGYVMHILASTGDTDSVDQLYAEYMSILPDSRQEHTPLQVMAALMFAKLRGDDHESVEECWHLCLAQAKERGQPLPPISTGSSADNGDDLPLSPYKIVPNHQLNISRHLYYYLESLSIQNKIDLMVQTVNGVLEDGFLLDNRTWNHYVQILSQKFRYKLAFKNCEDKLIENWTGWAMIRWQAPVRNRLPFDLRNLRKRPKHLRPIHITLLYLARSLLDIQGMAAESRSSEVLLQDIRQSFPRTVRAIETMPRTDTDLERRILREW